ncbi:hypothetical protein [Ktedonobacter sp. SOSP1-52]|uniref:hypothetical protein n=1 Tax=Ktedonobacter sp. SOSP1-52 TaxID=2778366 RepID=UPI001914F5AA|nr:hypothetical protein [Ktedonobacter sp. SOSP1-52]
MQSVDTHHDDERVFIDLIHKAPVERRFRLVQSLTQRMPWLPSSGQSTLSQGLSLPAITKVMRSTS